MQTPNTFRGGPDARGHFGIYGGRFVAETLMPLILAVEAAYNAAKADPTFQAELDYYLDHYVGRPSPLYFAERLTRHFGGAKLYLKRDELNHTGAHKINNCLGQVLLARRMDKRRIIAETGAGQHGVATATACALFGMDCVVYMGVEDIRRQQPDLQRVIGDEAREQLLAAEQRLPARVVACVGGGSNAIGTFAPFIDDERVELVGVEAGARASCTARARP